jgi:hypothetical protein
VGRSLHRMFSTYDIITLCNDINRGTMCLRTTTCYGEDAIQLDLLQNGPFSNRRAWGIILPIANRLWIHTV